MNVRQTPLPHGRLVTFAWDGPPGEVVELAGELPDWKYPHRMQEGPPGHYECALALEAGVYRYKLRLGRSRWVDPGEGPLDASDGVGNRFLVVDGAAPPIVFAPDRRHVGRLDDGTVLMHLEVLPGGPPSVVARLELDGQAPVQVPLELVASRNGQRCLRGRAVAGSGRGALCFEGGARLPLPPPRSALGRPPRWLEGATFYTVFLDRWHRGTGSPPLDTASSREAPSTAETSYGGDLDGVREALPYFEELGVDALVLTPLHPSPTPHRYDSVDLTRVDEAIGGEPALRRLIDGAHARGLRLVLDVAVTHVNEAHPAFQDLLQHQERSPYAGWFRPLRYPVVARDLTTFHGYYDRPELPWLDLRPGPAREHVLEVVERMVEAGADGLRLDAVNDAPADFWAELRARARAKNPDLLLLGEIVSDNLACLAEERGVDVATDFMHREAMLDFFARGAIEAGQFTERITFDEFRVGAFERSFRLLFVDNHDTWRFTSIAFFRDRLRLALTYLLFRPEPVALTYGTEHALAGDDLSKSGQLDDAWPERLPMPPLSTRGDTFRLISQLTRLRRALRDAGPTLRVIDASGRRLAIERPVEGGVLTAWLNAGDAPVTLEAPARSRLVLSVNESPARIDAALGPWAGRILFTPGGGQPS